MSAPLDTDDYQAYVAAIVDAAPPLTAAQVSTLAALFDDGTTEA